jgi:hypothetical protein
MAQNFPRGIAPELLVSQVRNTMPYLFEGEAPTALRALPPAQVLRARAPAAAAPLDHLEYFRLCVSAHLLTCGTPVPTDVDNQIRLKLWPAGLPLETAARMTELVLECRTWDFRPLSTRWTQGAKGTLWRDEALSGHLGEWFTLSAAAYCALGRYSAPEAAGLRERLFQAITEEVRRHSEIFGSLWRGGDGVGALRAAASIAHNFGDLDRVLDIWELGAADPLRRQFYKAAAQPLDAQGKLRFLGRLWVAGELYKATIQGSAMALENHRHFALRKPRGLRRSPEFLIPTGPFFDDWGRRVARGLADADGAPSADTHEVIQALVHGWERLPRTVGYGRGLRGILEAHPGLMKPEAWLPRELLRDHARRQVIERSQESFERAWGDAALALMDEIPSRM